MCLWLDMLITRLRPSLFLAGWMAAWAVVCTLTAVTHNYTGLLLTRFFLGVAEAPFWPGLLYLLNVSWPIPLSQRRTTDRGMCLDLLHPKRSCRQSCYSLQCQHCRDGICRSHRHWRIQIRRQSRFEWMEVAFHHPGRHQFWPCHRRRVSVAG